MPRRSGPSRRRGFSAKNRLDPCRFHNLSRVALSLLPQSTEDPTMSDLQIIGAPASNFVWVTRIACAEKGVPYTFVPTLPHTPEVRAIHPFGKIPVARHGAVALCESRAICLYIDRAFPGPALVPADPAGAALVEQWLSLLNTQI